MNDFQIARQVRYLLGQRKWEGNASYDPIFGSEAVCISVADIEAFLAYARTPCAMIRIGDAAFDPDHGEESGAMQFGFTIRLIQAVFGDATGEAALIGAYRAGATTTGQASSQGRGLAEIEEEVRAAVSWLRIKNGVRVQFAGKSGIGYAVSSDGNHKVFRDLIFEAQATSDRDYETATNFRATNGVGSIALAWTNPPDRFDLYKIVIRRAAGSTPPATVTDGTGVTIAVNTITALVTRNDLTSSLTDTIVAGTYSYSFFAQYDETHNPGSAPTSAERTSPAATITGAVSS